MITTNSPIPLLSAALLILSEWRKNRVTHQSVYDNNKDAEAAHMKDLEDLRALKAALDNEVALIEHKLSGSNHVVSS